VTLSSRAGYGSHHGGSKIQNVLVAHNRYQQRGGEGESTSLEIALLRSRGHKVTKFIEDNERIRDLSLPKVALRTVWSQESYRRLRRLYSGAAARRRTRAKLLPLDLPGRLLCGPD
jgi:hypothetical protein